MKVVRGICIAVCVFVVGMSIMFGNMPRSFVDRMNLLLAPLVLGSMVLGGYSLWRFRRACLAEREVSGR